MRALNLWVVGGDQRQAKLAELLAEDGHRVHTYALEGAGEPGGTVLPAENLEKLNQADCVILPLPAVWEGERLHTPLSDREIPIIEVLDAMAPGQLLTGGRLDETTLAAAEARGLICRDYFAREELAVANAVPGALAVWLCETGRLIRPPTARSWWCSSPASRWWCTTPERSRADSGFEW